MKNWRKKLETHKLLSGGVEPKKNPTESLGGLSEIMPSEFRELPWALKLPGNSRCLWIECCLELPLFLEFPCPSLLLPPVEQSTTLKFSIEASPVEYLEFSSILSWIGLLCLLWDLFDLNSCKLMIFIWNCMFHTKPTWLIKSSIYLLVKVEAIIYSRSKRSGYGLWILTGAFTFLPILQCTILQSN